MACGLACSSDEKCEGPKCAGVTDTGPSITDQINAQFNVCPLRTSLGKEWTNTAYESCTFDSLATAGVGVHEFDGTTYMPVPWGMSHLVLKI